MGGHGVVSPLHQDSHPSFPPEPGDLASWLIKHASQPNIFDPLELTLKNCYAWQHTAFPAMRDFHFFVIDSLSHPTSYNTFCLIRSAPVAVVRWSQMARQLAVKAEWLL